MTKTFDYFGNLEDWADENGYDAYDVIDEQVLIKKRSSLVGFYLHKEENDTYAEFTAYSDYDNGYFDITLVKEGLKKKEKEIITIKYEYV